MDENWISQLERQFAALPAWLRPIDRGVVRATEWVLALVGGLFTAMIALEVASRFFFGFSTFFISGASRFLLLWFFLLGAGIALRYGAHVGFELLVNACKPRVRRLVRTVAEVLALLFFAEMVWAGIASLGPATTQTDSSLGVSLVWGFLAVPVGFTLVAYHMVILIIADFRAPHSEKPSG